MRKGKFELYPNCWHTFEYDENAKISTHLTFDEIDNSDCKEDIKLVVSQDTMLAIKCWEYVRERYGKAIKVSSCYRESAYNASVGGAKNSFHLYGCAFDCQVGNLSDTDYAKWLRWVECACEKYGVKAEVGRYKWGLHLGFMKIPTYTINSLVYEFDKR